MHYNRTYNRFDFQLQPCNLFQLQKENEHFMVVLQNIQRLRSWKYSIYSETIHCWIPWRWEEKLRWLHENRFRLKAYFSILTISVHWPVFLSLLPLNIFASSVSTRFQGLKQRNDRALMKCQTVNLTANFTVRIKSLPAGWRKTVAASVGSVVSFIFLQVVFVFKRTVKAEILTTFLSTMNIHARSDKLNYLYPNHIESQLPLHYVCLWKIQ